MRACVIGAGSSGLAACKGLLDAGVAFDCYEMSDRVGGLWVYENPSGVAAAYRGLFSNAPTELMRYPSLEMPDDVPDYPSHWDFARYFQAYAERFGLLEHIRFGTKVEHVEPLAGGGFDVTLDDGALARYDAVLVANGHHWDPKLPDPPFPGSFDGIEMHSSRYREPSFATGKRVAVVGMGNSAVDIATELSEVAERTFLVARRGVHIMPKFFFGRAPTPGLIAIASYKPGRRLMGAMVTLIQGRPESHGLPKPDHRFGDAHPTMSARLVDRIRHHRITPKPGIASLEGDRIRFADGTAEAVDVVVYATGYRISFPFFDPEYFSAPDNRVALFRQVADPARPGLFFIGLCQPLGAIQPLAEAQGAWVGEVLAGRCSLPSPAAMERAIDEDQRARAKRFYASTRHTIQVDHTRYLRGLRAEVRRGRRRAGRGGTAAVGAGSAAQAEAPVAAR